MSFKMSADLTKAWLSNLETLFIEKGPDWLRTELVHMCKFKKARLVNDEIDNKNTRETEYRIFSTIDLPITIEILETEVSTILITWLGTTCRIKTKEKPRTDVQGFLHNN
jgi:hypothetical protein